MAHRSVSRLGVPFTNVVITTVKPLEKTAHVDTIDPTFLDMVLGQGYVPTIFAYRLADKSEAAYSQLVKRMKESLQKVLIPFFSFAGRWVAVTTQSNTEQLLCNDEGVPFIEAYLDRDLDSILHASTEFQPVPELNGFDLVGMDSSQYLQAMQPDGLPSVFVQLTRFKCGGVVLAVTFCHEQTDAKGLLDFMTAWSDISRTNETSIKVDHNRAPVDTPALKALITRRKEGEPKAATYAPKLETWVMKAFEVSASTIKSRKQEAEDEEGGRGFVSTGDCILAQLLKSVAVIDGREPILNTVVEGRNRFFDPPLSYLCGNCFTAMPSLKLSNREVLEMPHGSIASRFRDTLAKTRMEDWLSFESFREIMKRFDANKFARMDVSSWAKFQLYEINFGFGKPYLAVGMNCFTSQPAATGMTYIGPPFPNSTSSVASVHIWSHPDVLQALERDPQFLSFFS